MDEGSMHAKYFSDRPSGFGGDSGQTHRHTDTQTDRQTEMCLYYIDELLTDHDQLQKWLL